MTKRSPTIRRMSSARPRRMRVHGPGPDRSSIPPSLRSHRRYRSRDAQPIAGTSEPWNDLTIRQEEPIGSRRQGPREGYRPLRRDNPGAAQTDHPVCAGRDDSRGRVREARLAGIQGRSASARHTGQLGNEPDRPGPDQLHRQSDGGRLHRRKPGDHLRSRGARRSENRRHDRPRRARPSKRRAGRSEQRRGGHRHSVRPPTGPERSPTDLRSRPSRTGRGRCIASSKQSSRHSSLRWKPCPRPSETGRDRWGNDLPRCRPCSRDPTPRSRWSRWPSVRMSRLGRAQN